MKRFRTLMLGLLVGLSPMLAFAGKIDINSASAKALQSLDGVGSAKAAAIVAYREEHGRFKSVDQLVAVDGIGAGTLADNRDRLTAQ